MFSYDSKNYHVWSYRQYLVRKFPQHLYTTTELASIEDLIAADVRNNSAWSHRFFLVFSDPSYCTPAPPKEGGMGGAGLAGTRANERDEGVPKAVLDREVDFSKGAIRKAPQNESPWNYLRGVIRKGGIPLKDLEGFAGEFVHLGDGDGKEVVKSSHALDFLADVWSDGGETVKADRAWELLATKYDRIRKAYWEWKREVAT